MSDSISTLLFQIRAVIMVGTVLLSLGSLIGILIKGRGAFSAIRSEESLRQTIQRAHIKRKSMRVKSDSLLELKNADTGEYVPGVAYLHDLSIEGACFDSPWILKPGKTIEARLHSSKEGALHISAKIVWSVARREKIYYGVHFQQMSPAHP